ncbi:SMAD6 protein, partial [Motacilla alba]|nr:SMAD6 protein [Motacilla alba]
LKPAVHALFKKLKDEELELLLQVVESRGAWESGCVLAPRGDPRGVKQGLPPQVLLCRLFRWPDLHQSHELKHLCYCAGGQGACGDLAGLCCNPHHFSRLAVPETPPPPYLKASREHENQGTEPAVTPSRRKRLRQGMRGSCWGSLCSPLPETSLSWSTIKDGCWCKLAYWEYRTRVGRLYAVHEASV